MKITRNSLKELIRQSIDELKEGGPGSGPGGDEDNPFDKEPSDDDLSNIEKEFEGVNESVNRKRTTVKEIKTWMKTLEENRYKKTYNSDCRRVSWLVNNHMTEDYESMPISMRKKWSKAAYGRERQLAKEFIKHKRNEAKLRESIKKIVSGLITEQTLNEVRYQEITISLDDFDKVRKLFKPKRQQIVKHPYSTKTFGLKVDKKQYDKTLELLMKKRIDVQG